MDRPASCATQKFMENDFWGLSSATTQIKNYAQQYGTDALTLDGHSRGAMTIGNALESLLRAGETKSMTGTNINLFGPAYNAQNMANMLVDLGGSATGVAMENHKDDPVGTLVGGNRATGGDTPDGSSHVWEMIRAGTGQKNTSHNCYGAGPTECQSFWPGGQPKLETVPAQNAGDRK